jgi:hypothetical protein
VLSKEITLSLMWSMKVGSLHKLHVVHSRKARENFIRNSEGEGGCCGPFVGGSVR